MRRVPDEIVAIYLACRLSLAMTFSMDLSVTRIARSTLVLGISRMAIRALVVAR
jgi:hypothetical protein